MSELINLIGQLSRWLEKRGKKVVPISLSLVRVTHTSTNELGPFNWNGVCEESVGVESISRDGSSIPTRHRSRSSSRFSSLPRSPLLSFLYKYIPRLSTHHYMLKV